MGKMSCLARRVDYLNVIKPRLGLKYWLIKLEINGINY